MSNKKAIPKIIEAFKNYNSKLTVIRIIRYGLIYIVIAVYHIENGFREMDPLYIYHPITGKISGYCPTSNLRRFGRMQRRGKVIYTHSSVKDESNDDFT